MKIKTKIKIRMIIFTASIIGLILAFAICHRKFVEAVFMLGTFFITRYEFSKTFHYKKIWMCAITSILMFWVPISIVIPKNISILLSPTCGFLISAGLYLVRDYLDLKNEKRKTLKEMTEIEFEQYCKHRNLSDVYTQIAKCIYRDELKGEALYQKTGYSKRRIIDIRKEIARKLR